MPEDHAKPADDETPTDAPGPAEGIEAPTPVIEPQDRYTGPWTRKRAD